MKIIRCVMLALLLAVTAVPFDRTIVYANDNIEQPTNTPQPTQTPTESPAPTATPAPSASPTPAGSEMLSPEEAKRKADDGVRDMMSKFRPTADIDTAAAMMYGVRSTIDMILGVICYIIIIGMAIFSATDICYINIPIFQEKCENLKSSDGVGARVGTREGRDGNRRINFLTLEAQYAVENANLGEGRSPMKIYLGKRIWAYIFTTIVVYMLLSGNIEILTNFALRIVSSLMGAIQAITTN